MILWWRSWHGAPTDLKWSVIAARSGVKTGIVSAIVWALLDYASQNDPRGDITGFDIETYSVYSGFSESDILSVIKALEEKYVIEGTMFSAWDKRQPEREDDSLERVRRHRKNVTQCNAEKRNVTQCNAPDTDTDTDKELKDKEPDGSISQPPEQEPPETPNPPLQEKEDIIQGNPVWDMLHGKQPQQAPQNRPPDVEWCPQDIQELAAAFLVTSGLPVPIDKSTRGYWIKELRSMLGAGLSPGDLKSAIVKMRKDAICIKSPGSVKAVAFDTRAASQTFTDPEAQRLAKMRQAIYGGAA